MPWASLVGGDGEPDGGQLMARGRRVRDDKHEHSKFENSKFENSKFET
jgi:hypothetical protein